MEGTTLQFRKLDHDVRSFSCGNGSIEQMIREAYFQCLLGISYTYELVANQDIVGYICIVLHRICPDDLDDEYEVEIGRSFSYYAVELKFLGIEEHYQHQGMGTEVLRVIIQRLQVYHMTIPYRFIYIEALKEKAGWYNLLGFKCFDNPDLSGATVPMYMDLMSYEDIEILNKYIEELGG